jgi:signal peptidase I
MRKKETFTYDEDLDHSLIEDILDFIKTFLALSLVIVVLTFFVIKPVVISGRSMLPLLENGEKGFSNIALLAIEGLERGDIVVAKVTLEDGSSANVIKRVIGLPNETISCSNETIYINGSPLDESEWLDDEYIEICKEAYGYFNEDFSEVTLQSDEYFLLGDNRPISKDSRDLGAIINKNILAKDLWVFYPFSKFGTYYD